MFTYDKYKQELKPYQYDRLKQKYFSALVEELTRSALINHLDFQHDDAVFPVSLDRLRTNMGFIAVNKQKTRLWDYVQKRTPIVAVIQTGSNYQKALSAIKIIDGAELMRNIDLAEYNQTVKDYEETEFNMEPVRVDRVGLEELSRQLHIELRNPTLTEYVRNKKHREQLCTKMILKVTEDNGLLQQRGELSSTGRLYLKGLNLQSAPKRVRSVALGAHYIYDFSTCSFGVLTSLYFNICKGLGEDPNPNTITLRGYVQQKDEWRTSLTRDIYFNDQVSGLVINTPAQNVKNHVGYTVIKEAMNAIGFGARATANCWRQDGKLKKTALLEIFRYQDKADAFLNHWFVKKFLAELKIVTNVIVEYYKAYEPDLEILNGFKYEGRKTKNKVLAHIYQGHEVLLCSKLLDIAGEGNLALPLHDGIATYYPLPKSALLQTKYEIQQEYPFVKLGEIESKGALKANDYASDDADYRHRQRIAEEEMKALNYKNNYS